MHRRAEKSQSHKSRSTGTRIFRAQYGRGPVFQFVDNRTIAEARGGVREIKDHTPRAARLNDLQEMADVSRQAGRIESLVDMAGNSARQPENKDYLARPRTGLNAAAIQLMPAWESLERTESSKYGTEDGDRHVLYGSQAAVPPRPAGLYSVASDSHSEVQYQVWKPNVVFASKDQRATLEREQDSVYRLREEGSLPAGLITEKVKTMVDFVENIARTIVDNIDQQDGSPTTGVLGVNDCGNWANKLREMIAAELGDEEKEEGEIHSKFDTEGEAELPEVSAPGDQMTHLFNDVEDLGCTHHSATVVAVDGADLVTLEAHASKDLTAPEFHVRHGLQGFVTDNDTGAERQSLGLGGKGHVAKASRSKDAAVASLKRVQDLLDQYDYEAEDAPAELLQILNKFPLVNS